MNQPQIIKPIPPEWVEIIRLAKQIKMGEIVLKIQDNKVILAEYTIKRKTDSPDDFTAFPL
jgi:hypothetical protein